MSDAWPFGDLPIFGFDFIMADPPWHFRTYSEAGEEKSPQAQYETMSLDDIKALPVGHLAARDCLLWLWATHPMLPDQIDVMRAWGFRYSTSGVWVKRDRKGAIKMGTGYRLRSSSEPFLIGVNGEPPPPEKRNILTVIDAPAREHSRKPELAYQAAERMSKNARRLDLFSRQSRPGWIAWGKEAGKFDKDARS